MTPVTITPLKPSDLHHWWPLIQRGLTDIARKVQPDHLPEDVYAMLLPGTATCCIVSRGARTLGFFVYHKQERPWSHKLDLFLWAGWAIPLRERLPDDDIPDAIHRSIEYIENIRKELAAYRKIAVTSRPGFIRKYGFKVLATTFEF